MMFIIGCNKGLRLCFESTALVSDARALTKNSFVPSCISVNIIEVYIIEARLCIARNVRNFKPMPLCCMFGGILAYFRSDANDSDEDEEAKEVLHEALVYGATREFVDILG